MAGIEHDFSPSLLSQMGKSYHPSSTVSEDSLRRCDLSLPPRVPTVLPVPAPGPGMNPSNLDLYMSGLAGTPASYKRSR